MRKILLGTVTGLTFIVGTALLLVPRMAPRDSVSIGDRIYERVELRLNEFTSSTQSNVSLDMNREGDILVAWDSRRQQSGTYGIYARKIGSDGTILGNELQVNVQEQSMQTAPAVAWLESGTPIVAWTSFGQDGSGGGIVARSTGDELFLPESGLGNQSEVALARFGNGSAIAAWTSAETVSKQSIRGRVLDSRGNPTGSELLISGSSADLDRLPSVDGSEHGFVVTWDRSSQDGEIAGIFARRFDADGNPLGSEFRVSAGDVDEIEPTVAIGSDGAFAIGWMRLDAESDYDPYVRRYDRFGTPTADPAPICSDCSGWQSGLAVDLNSAGELAASWTVYHDDVSADVMARTFAANGLPTSNDFNVTTHRDGRQTITGHAGTKRIALSDDGTLAVSWHGDSGQGDPTAANVTLLRPSSSSPTEYASRVVRTVRNQLATLSLSESELFDPSASPVTPPVYDPETISGIVDPESYRRGEDGIGFVGITSTGWNPPDPHMAVGPNYVMLCTNGAIAAKDKDGTALWQEDLEGGGGFWGSEGSGTFVFDPEAHYDPYENRYYVMANERTGGRSYFLLGVSSTEDVTDSWHKYRWDVTAISGNDIDSPNLGFDESAIFLTADFFGPDKYLLFMIDKASVIDGGAAITNSYLRVGTQSMGVPAQYTAEAPRMYLLEHFDGGNQDELRIWSINNPFGVPTITSTNVDVDPYWMPGSSRSRGTSQQIYLFEARFWSCMYINGSIWAAHHIKSSSGSTSKARWYEIDMNGWPDSFENPEVVQQGTVDAGSDVYLTFNSISADDAGNAYMVFARSSVDEYYSMSRTYHLASDGAGVMSDPGVLKQSNTTYSGDRWGDYSAVNFDPVAPGKFWSHHEYTPGGNSWSTWVQCETLPFDPTSVPIEEAGSLAELLSYPNPSSMSSALRFSLPSAGDVRVEIFDAAGRQIRSIDADGLGHGIQEIVWDGRTTAGSEASNGVYLARVRLGGTPIAEGRITRTK